MTDNILANLHFSLSTLAKFSEVLKALAEEREIPPASMPILSSVEPVSRGKDAAPAAPPEAFRYQLVFPHSDYLKMDVKVKERAPSITQAEIEAATSPIHILCQGFYSGTFAVEKDACKLYAKAEAITPIRGTTPPVAGPRKEGV